MTKGAMQTGKQGFNQEALCGAAPFIEWSINLTDRVQNPADCAVSPAHQDPVVLQISEETESERRGRL